MSFRKIGMPGVDEPDILYRSDMEHFARRHVEQSQHEIFADVGSSLENPRWHGATVGSATLGPSVFRPVWIFSRTTCQVCRRLKKTGFVGRAGMVSRFAKSLGHPPAPFAPSFRLSSRWHGNQSVAGIVSPLHREVRFGSFSSIKVRPPFGHLIVLPRNTPKSSAESNGPDSS